MFGWGHPLVYFLLTDPSKSVWFWLVYFRVFVVFNREEGGRLCDYIPFDCFSPQTRHWGANVLPYYCSLFSYLMSTASSQFREYVNKQKKSHLRSSLEIGISFENGVVLFCKLVICSSVKYLEGISQKEKAINNSVNKQSAGVRRLYGMWPCQTGHPARAPVVKVSFSPQGSFHLSLFSSFSLLLFLLAFVLVWWFNSMGFPLKN